MKRYWLETYGCQMNVAESEALEQDLKSTGWIQASSPEVADAVLLHTCSVRQTAEDRIWGRIGYFKHIKQANPLRLVVMGCMAERLGKEIKNSHPTVDLVVGNFAKHRIAEQLDGLLENDGTAITAGNEEFRFSPLHAQEGSYHSYVPIMHGCDNFCSYCIVPHVRGREISRSPEDISVEIRRAEELGVREISLLGQNVNSYRYDDGGEELHFPDLLRRIIDSIEEIRWLRFITSHPKDVPSGLIELMAREKLLCRHFHLPVQHASNTILNAMNRRYTREEYLSVVEKLRTAVPDISITTDILVGFPGEEEADFEVLMDFVRDVRFDDAFMYYYNLREGTPAAEYPSQVPHEEKLDRLSRLIALQRSITLEKRKERIGSVDGVMIDGPSKKNPSEMRGHSERNEPVVLPGGEDLVGTIVPVRLEALSGTTYKGRVEESFSEY